MSQPSLPEIMDRCCFDLLQEYQPGLVAVIGRLLAHGETPEQIAERARQRGTSELLAAMIVSAGHHIQRLKGHSEV